MLEMVIFDADGVLFDSTESNVAYYNAIFAAVGEPPLDRSEAAAAVYYAATQVFERRARDNRALVEKMKDVARVIDQTPFFRLLRPALDLRPFLSGLRRRYRLGLATNRSATVPALIRHLSLEGVFDAVASVLDHVTPKPAPDILDLCLKRAGVIAPNAVYVGDSPIDIEAAAAAGTGFIAVGDRVEYPRRIAHLRELPEMLDHS